MFKTIYVYIINILKVDDLNRLVSAFIEPQTKMKRDLFVKAHSYFSPQKGMNGADGLQLPHPNRSSWPTCDRRSVGEHVCKIFTPTPHPLPLPLKAAFDFC
jgi:hypothetical protein